MSSKFIEPSKTRFYIIVLAIVVIGFIAGGLAWQYMNPAPFSLKVHTRPAVPMGADANMSALPGQKCIILVAVDDERGQWAGKAGLGSYIDVSCDVSEERATVTIQPESVAPGHIAEVIVVPEETSGEEVFSVTITGNRGVLKREKTITIKLIPGEDDIEPYASELRDLFIPWLATNHPELGITNETEWTGTIVNPGILVVMHYIFYSDEWEMYLTWHVMIPPHDWTRIHLRHRFMELSPSHAFEISSVKGKEDPHRIEVEEWV